MNCWGPIRWVNGIKEYIVDRCIYSGDTGFIQDDENRAYKHGNLTTDCCCVFSNLKDTVILDDDSDDIIVNIYDNVGSSDNDADSTTDDPSDIEIGSVCDNPLWALSCLPCMMVSHLMCLPVMCCYCNKPDWDNSKIARYKCWVMYAKDLNG
jgi:hypothetical protein